jgi:nuclear pore complex protein Nup160
MSSNLLDLISVNYFYNGLPKYFQHIITVFEHARAFAHVADFAHLALQSLELSPGMNDEYNSVRTDLMSRLFHASLKTCRFDEAFSAFLQLPDSALQKSAVTSLITTILTASGPGNAGLRRILHFPLSVNGSLCFHVDLVLESLAKKQLSATSSLGQAIPVSGWQDPANIPNYNRILQAFRIARNDFRGAAEVAYRRVSHIRDARDRSHAGGKQIATALDADEEVDLESKELRHELLALINLLACMEKIEAYIVVEQTQQSARRASSGNRRDSSAGQGDTAMDGLAPADTLHADASLGDSIQSRRGSTGPFSQSRPDERSVKRVIITLEDLRREYQGELDRVSRIARGDWEFGVVAAEPEESDGEDMMNLENGAGHDRDVVMGDQ